LSEGVWHNLYGIKVHNWIEAKFFGGIGRTIGQQDKTAKAGLVAYDLFRLCLYVQEENGPNRDNGRYLVAVFNRKPERYLAFRRRNRAFPKRKWLKLLLEPGDKQIQITLEQEPPIFREAFGERFREHHQNLDLKLRVVTRAFSPVEPLSEYLYWGYLIRVVDFEISLGDDKLIYKDASKERWTKQHENIQKKLIERALEMRKT